MRSTFTEKAKTLKCKCKSVENFPLNTHIIHLSRFFRLLNHSQNSEKVANFALHKGVPVAKSFQLQRCEAPLTPGQGLCPWNSLRAPPPDRRYRLAPRVRHGKLPFASYYFILF